MRKKWHQSAAQWSASAIWHISLLIFIEQFGERLPFAYFNICEVKRIKWNKIKRCLQVLFQCWVSSLKASCGTFCYIKTLSPRYLSHSSSLLTAHSFLSDIVMKLTAQAKQANNPKATLCRQFHLLLYIEIHLIATTLSNANMRFINAGSWPKINAEIGSSHFNQKSCMKGKNFRISQYFLDTILRSPQRNCFNCDIILIRKNYFQGAISIFQRSNDQKISILAAIVYLCFDGCILWASCNIKPQQYMLSEPRS